jgi:hypothetical protein
LNKKGRIEKLIQTKNRKCFLNFVNEAMPIIKRIISIVKKAVHDFTLFIKSVIPLTNNTEFRGTILSNVLFY